VERGGEKRTREENLAVHKFISAFSITYIEPIDEPEEIM
jgi:hypothetical protein